MRGVDVAGHRFVYDKDDGTILSLIARTTVGGLPPTTCSAFSGEVRPRVRSLDAASRRTSARLP